jgi:predicted phage terminase large subunit-like protein
VYKEYEAWKLGSPIVLIEDKSSGTSVIQHLRSTTKIPIIPIVPYKSKELRLEAVLPQIESGRLWLPNKAPWLYSVEEQISQFPLGKHDDIVDAISQYLNYKFGKRTRKSAISRYIR